MKIIRPCEIYFLFPVISQIFICRVGRENISFYKNIMYRDYKENNSIFSTQGYVG